MESVMIYIAGLVTIPVLASLAVIAMAYFMGGDWMDGGE